MFAHIYRADGREENIELDYCYSDEEVAIAVCEDGDFGSGDRAIVCVTRWDGTQQRFRHRMVRVAVKGNEIRHIGNGGDVPDYGCSGKGCRDKQVGGSRPCEKQGQASE